MQAILQGKHNRFCAWLQENKHHPAVDTKEINAMETELHNIYDSYRVEMENLRKLIDYYEQTKKNIRVRVKENIRELKDHNSRNPRASVPLGSMQ